jgi:hypothetical protein
MEHVIMEEVAPQTPNEQSQGNDEQEGFNGVQCQHQ